MGKRKNQRRKSKNNNSSNNKGRDVVSIKQNNVTTTPTTTTLNTAGGKSNYHDEVIISHDDDDNSNNKEITIRNVSPIAEASSGTASLTDEHETMLEDSHHTNPGTSNFETTADEKIAKSDTNKASDGTLVNVAFYAPAQEQQSSLLKATTDELIKEEDTCVVAETSTTIPSDDSHDLVESEMVAETTPVVKDVEERKETPSVKVDDESSKEEDSCVVADEATTTNPFNGLHDLMESEKVAETTPIMKEIEECKETPSVKADEPSKEEDTYVVADEATTTNPFNGTHDFMESEKVAETTRVTEEVEEVKEYPVLLIPADTCVAISPLSEDSYVVATTNESGESLPDQKHRKGSTGVQTVEMDEVGAIADVASFVPAQEQKTSSVEVDDEPSKEEESRVVTKATTTKPSDGSLDLVESEKVTETTSVMEEVEERKATPSVKADDKSSKEENSRAVADEATNTKPSDGSHDLVESEKVAETTPITEEVEERKETPSVKVDDESSKEEDDCVVADEATNTKPSNGSHDLVESEKVAETTSVMEVIEERKATPSAMADESSKEEDSCVVADEATNTKPSDGSHDGVKNEKISETTPITDEVEELNETPSAKADESSKEEDSCVVADEATTTKPSNGLHDLVESEKIAETTPVVEVIEERKAAPSVKVDDNSSKEEDSCVVADEATNTKPSDGSHDFVKSEKIAESTSVMEEIEERKAAPSAKADESSKEEDSCVVADEATNTKPSDGSHDGVKNEKISETTPITDEVEELNETPSAKADEPSKEEDSCVVAEANTRPSNGSHDIVETEKVAETTPITEVIEERKETPSVKVDDESSKEEDDCVVADEATNTKPSDGSHDLVESEKIAETTPITEEVEELNETPSAKADEPSKEEDSCVVAEANTKPSDGSHDRVKNEKIAETTPVMEVIEEVKEYPVLSVPADTYVALAPLSGDSTAVVPTNESRESVSDQKYRKASTGVQIDMKDEPQQHFKTTVDERRKVTKVEYFAAAEAVLTAKNVYEEKVNRKEGSIKAGSSVAMESAPVGMVTFDSFASPFSNSMVKPDASSMMPLDIPVSDPAYNNNEMNGTYLHVMNCDDLHQNTTPHSSFSDVSATRSRQPWDLFILVVALVVGVAVLGKVTRVWMTTTPNGIQFVNALCAPIQSGTKLPLESGGEVKVGTPSTISHSFEAPWWAPPHYKELAFELVCTAATATSGSSRKRIRLDWTTPIMKQKRKLHRLVISTLVQEGGLVAEAILYDAWLTSAMVDTAEIKTVDKRGKQDAVINLWTAG